MAGEVFNRRVTLIPVWILLTVFTAGAFGGGPESWSAFPTDSSLGTDGPDDHPIRIPYPFADDLGMVVCIHDTVGGPCAQCQDEYDSLRLWGSLT